MLKPNIIICVLFLTIFIQQFNCNQQSFEIAKFISEQNQQFSSEINEFPIMSPATRNIQQESCVPLTNPVQYCDGIIPNNISYVTFRSINTVEPKLISQIDNFITKMEVNYGSITSECKSSAINLYCSMSFKRCVHDKSRGFVELYKPCQYLCQALYLNCIPDRKVAIASSRNDCGEDNAPKGTYSTQPTCTDVYFDRDVTAYYIMSFTLLGIGVMSSFVCAGSFLICICCTKSIKPSNSTVGDAYNQQTQSDTSSVNRQSINSGFRFSVDEVKPIFGNTNSNTNINNTSINASSINSSSVNNTSVVSGGGNGAFGGAGNDDASMTVINISGEN